MGRNRNEYAIYNSAAEFRIFDLVSGINEFQNYGRIQSLERFIAATGDETAGNLLECLKKVSEGIQYCSIKFFNEGLDRLSDFYKPNPVSEDRYIQMFLDSIKNDFETLLSNNRDILDEIKWCVRKGFFQQAFTLIENSMPDEYYKAGMISISSKLRKKAKACSARKRDSVPVFLFNYVVNNQFTAQIHDKVYDDELDELKELKELKEPRFYQINNRTGTCEVKFEINVEEASDLWTDVKLLLVAHKKVKDIRNDLMHGHEEDVKGVKPEDRHTIKNYRSRLEEYIQAADKIIGIWKGTKESIWKDRDKRPAALALSLSSSTKKETVAGTTVPPSAEAATPPGDGLQRLSKGTVLQGAEVKKVKGADVFFFLPGVESDGHCRMPDGMVLSPGELVDISIRYYNEKYHNYDVNVLQR